VMVLTFTGSLSIAEANRESVRTMLIGALGCNLAWGIIDGVLYLLGSLADKGSHLATLHKVRGAADTKKAHRLIKSALPPLIASLLQPSELETIRQRLLELPEPTDHARLTGRDFIGALGVFLFVFLSTFPVALPFMLMGNARAAMRTSNAVAIVMLFIAGIAYGKCIGRSPRIIGAAMVLLGAILVGLTIALGG